MREPEPPWPAVVPADGIRRSSCGTRSCRWAVGTHWPSAGRRAAGRGVSWKCGKPETSRWSLDRRVAEYTRRHDVTISAWRLGPFEVLLVDDASSVLLEMQEWERPHPDEERLKRRAASMWDT